MNRDNKGFSLVELLVVIAVMAILAGVGLQGFGLVANGNMKKTAGLLNEELRTVQKNSKNIYVDYYWQLVIENDDGGYKVEIIRMNKKTITNPDGSTTDILDPEVYDSQELPSRMKLQFTCGTSKIDMPISEGNMLVVTYHKGSGAIDRVEYDAISKGLTNEADLNDVYAKEKAAELGFAEQNENLQIEVTSDSISSTKSVTAYFNTGKVVSK